MRTALVSGTLLLLCFSASVFAQSTATQAQDPADAGSFTVGVEALDWQLKDSPLPFPVVTDGVLGQADTHVLLGSQALSIDSRRGIRLSAAYALSDRFGLEGNLFRLGSRSASAGIESSGESGSTDLFFPYIDADTGQESAFRLSMANIYSGGAREELSNRLQGAELNGTWVLASDAPLRVDLLGGVRYLRLRETYMLTTHSPYLPALGSDTWDTSDRFDTANNFYGVQAGVRAHFDRERFFADGTIKVGMGAMAQSVGISGSLVTNDFTTFGPLQTFSGGYLALPSNIGNYSRTTFAVVPEAALNLGYRISSAITLNLGYSFLYANNVVRPGNQVSRTINTTQSVSYTESLLVGVQGPTSPEFKFKGSGFWVQGINVGLTVRF